MSKNFRDARQEITGDSWLDDLARVSLSAAEAKFSGHETPPLRVALGSFAAVAASVAGTVLAVLHGRKASVSVTATPHMTPPGVVVAARPIVKAVGISRVKFHATKGVTIRLTEVYAEDGELKEGRSWTKIGAFSQQHVDSGEELSTTVMFPPVNPPGSVIGWLVFLKIVAHTRWALGSAWWMDQVFVPRPVSVREKRDTDG